MCPYHGIAKGSLIHIFYRGLDYHPRSTLSSSSGGVFMYKTPNQGYQMLEDMSVHNLEWNPDKRMMQKKTHINSLDHESSKEVAALHTNQKVLEKEIETLTTSLHSMQVGCDNCKGSHLTKDCVQNQPMMTPEEVSYMQQGFGGNFQGGNRNWGNNRNFNPRQNPPGFYPHNQQNNPRPDDEQKPILAAIVEKFIASQTKVNEDVGQALRNQQSMIQNLERTVGTTARVLNERPNGELPPNT
jgi:hypothetical protein